MNRQNGQLDLGLEFLIFEGRNGALLYIFHEAFICGSTPNPAGDVTGLRAEFRVPSPSAGDETYTRVGSEMGDVRLRLMKGPVGFFSVS